MRAPVVCGVAGGVGTRTVTAAMEARYGGVPTPPRPCDVLICRATVHSLGLAERYISAIHGRPVLAVVLDAERMPAAVQAKRKIVDGQCAATVPLPWVSKWRELSDPYVDVAGLLMRTPQEVPKHLRKFHKALLLLARQVRPLLADHIGGVRPAPAVQPRSTGPHRPQPPYSSASAAISGGF